MSAKEQQIEEEEEEEELNLNAPSTIDFDSHVFDLAFHPSHNLVAAGLISGSVHCYQYDVEENGGNTNKWSLDAHTKSCRDVEFNHNGRLLYTASRDKSWRAIDVETGVVSIKKLKAHEEPVNCMLTMGENLFATGDESGVIKLWDERTQEAVQTYSDNSDFVADMEFIPHKKTLLAACADGFLSVFDIRKSKIVAQSEQQDDELLSLVTVKNNKKVIVGSQDGILSLFTWGQWLDSTDRYPGHPQSVDTIVKIDEDTVATGSSDGLIRIVSILPNKLLGVIGDHGEFPVECIRLDKDKRYLGSCSHDSTVKFWDVEDLFEEGDNEEEEEEREKEVVEGDSAPSQKKRAKESDSEEDGWSDMDGAEEVEEEEEVEEVKVKVNKKDKKVETKVPKNKKQKINKKEVAAAASSSVKGAKKQFFSGLD